jgi:hypothetical protein
MAVFGPQDRELLSVTEFALIGSSRPAQIKAFTVAQLKAKITRARKYWDKYRTLARQQHRSNKSDSERDRPQPFSNVRTERKAQLFAEALSRFEKRATQIQPRDQPEQGARAKASRTGTEPQATQRASLRKKKQRRQAAAESALTTGVTRQFQKSKQRAIEGHIRASGARRQGKRDAR